MKGCPMKNYRWITILVSLCLSSSLAFPGTYQKQTDGVLFEFEKQKETNVQWLKIQICTDDIIRVIASPDTSFSVRPSLMVEKTVWEPVPMVCEREGKLD